MSTHVSSEERRAYLLDIEVGYILRHGPSTSAELEVYINNDDAGIRAYYVERALAQHARMDDAAIELMISRYETMMELIARGDWGPRAQWIHIYSQQRNK